MISARVQQLSSPLRDNFGIYAIISQASHAGCKDTKHDRTIEHHLGYMSGRALYLIECLGLLLFTTFFEDIIQCLASVMHWFIRLDANHACMHKTSEAFDTLVAIYALISRLLWPHWEPYTTTL